MCGDTGKLLHNGSSVEENRSMDPGRYQQIAISRLHGCVQREERIQNQLEVDISRQGLDQSDGPRKACSVTACGSCTERDSVDSGVFLLGEAHARFSETMEAREKMVLARRPRDRRTAWLRQ